MVGSLVWTGLNTLKFGNSKHGIGPNGAVSTALSTKMFVSWIMFVDEKPMRPSFINRKDTPDVS